MTPHGASLNPAIERFNLEEYVQEHGAEEVQEREGEWLLTCPSCGKEKLTVNTQKKTWHCWICQDFVDVITASGVKRQAMAGAGGLIDLIQKLEECDRQEAISRILAAGHLQAHELAMLPEAEFQKELRDASSLESAVIPFPENPSLVSESGFAMAYCKSRGITEEDIYRFGLTWCWSGRYVNRLIFPVYEQGRFVYFQARAMWTPKPGEKFVKAINPKRREGSAVSSEVLMNLDVAATHPRVCITEGPIDCIHAGYDAVCTFGKQISSVQIAKLMQAGVKAVDLMWDGPSEGEPGGAYAEMVKAAQSMSALFDVRIVRLPWGDPGDYERAQLHAFRQHNVEILTGIRSL